MDHSLVHIYEPRTGPSSGSEMRVSLTVAKAQLTELVRMVESGDEVILTRHVQPVCSLTPIKTLPDKATRRAYRSMGKI